jgi:hypothetical protein
MERPDKRPCRRHNSGLALLEEDQGTDTPILAISGCTETGFGCDRGRIRHKEAYFDQIYSACDMAETLEPSQRRGTGDATKGTKSGGPDMGDMADCHVRNVRTSFMCANM